MANMLRGSQKYQMEKKGQNSMKKRSLKKKNKKMNEMKNSEAMQPMDQSMTKMKGMDSGGAVKGYWGKKRIGR